MSTINDTGAPAPRVWPKGSPEPADATAVRSIRLIWTKQADGLWHSSLNSSVAYPWTKLNRLFTFTEVTVMTAVGLPSFEDVFGARPATVASGPQCSEPCVSDNPMG